MNVGFIRKKFLNAAASPARSSWTSVLYAPRAGFLVMYGFVQTFLFSQCFLFLIRRLTYNRPNAKMAAKLIFFVFVLVRKTSLVLKELFFCTSSVLTRLVRLISTKTKEYFFGRHLCIRSIGRGHKGQLDVSVTALSRPCCKF